MDLFKKEDYLSKEEQSKLIYKESHSFLMQILVFVCKTPFKLFGVIISIIYKACFGTSKISVQDMDIDQRLDIAVLLSV